MVDSPKTKDYTPMNAIKFPTSGAIDFLRPLPLPPPRRDFVEIAGWHRTESPTSSGMQIYRTNNSWHLITTDEEGMDASCLQLFHLHQGADAGACLLSCRLEIRALQPCLPAILTIGLMTGAYFGLANALALQPTPAWQSIDLGYHCQPQPDPTRIITKLYLQPDSRVEIRQVELWQAAC